jgi:predicted acylesterase/phospholipase RssA
MKHLVIGPGAMTYFAFLGALAALRDSDDLQNLEEISGSSAGGLLAFFYIVSDGNIKSILDYSLDVPLKDIMKLNIRLFLKDFGLVSQKKVRQTLVKIIQIYFSKDDVTFKELWELRPNMPQLYISAYCVNLNKTEYFSRVTNPNMSILDALCMSIAVPFLFASVTWDGHRYIDGGTLEETPACPFVGKNDVKVLRCTWSDKDFDTRNLKSYLGSFFTITMQRRHKYNFPTINIDMSHFDFFDFGMSTEMKLKLFSLGYHSTKRLGTIS